ncbi:MAG: bifunctional adenosylcobinamide kinase/adenosylcobinamide-phosphate guanylyltransferase [Deferribacteres bacterium]|nr:bifunctional adenosylcobinamide kinase/adenosylcobinamide-phosphate guanylyltransferase [Deferribacteres bacterium]
MKIVFVTGGARSGKSAFALREASGTTGQKAYIATAQALDREMQERIEKHKRERGAEWDTYEEPRDIATVLSDIKDRYSAVVLDCLTLWLSNVLSAAGGPVEDTILEFAGELSRLKKGAVYRGDGARVFIVSNEVGMGIVPENETARRFRDLAGLLNQRVAGIADEVYLVTAGIPLRIK